MQESRPAASDEMPFLDHLEELRWRIIWSLAALVVCVGLSFFVFTQMDVIGLLERPILPLLKGHKLIYTHPGEAFSIVLNAAIALGCVLALPVVFYQLWSFIAPALHQHEKKLVMPMIFFAMFLFACGVSLSWFVVLPLKGLPAGGGFHFPGVLVGPIVNGLWGLGTAVFLALAAAARRRQPA